MPANSILNVVNSKVGTIQKITKLYGEVSARALVAFYISDLLQFMNLTRTMTTPQISALVDVLISCYPDYTPEDYIRFTDRFKKGQYGKLFEGVDGTKIIEAVEIYDKQEREPELEAYRKQQKDKEKAESPMAPELLPFLKGLLKTDTEAPVDLSFIEKPKREPTEHEKAVQRYIREFDTVWLSKHDQENQAIKEIRLPSGLMVTLEQYITQRFDDEYGENKPGSIELILDPEAEDYLTKHKRNHVKECPKCRAMMVKENDKYICKYC